MQVMVLLRNVEKATTSSICSAVAEDTPPPMMKAMYFALSNEVYALDLYGLSRMELGVAVTREREQRAKTGGTSDY